MEAARRVAGYSLGGADILRRAMGKKKPEEMAKQREIFVKGARKQMISPRRKPMRSSVFWKNLPVMDLINHIQQLMA